MTDGATTPTAPAEATWADWVRLHATIYGMHAPQDVEMLQAWAGLFALEGWTPRDMVEATRWVATHCALKYRPDALAALQERVRGERRRLLDAGANRDREEQRGCRLCNSTGWVVVPDPRAVRRGEYAQMVACCNCPLGRWRVREGDGRPSIELWFVHMPDWEEVMAAYARLTKARLAAEQNASGIDRTLGQLQERIEEGWFEGRAALEEK